MLGEQFHSWNGMVCSKREKFPARVMLGQVSWEKDNKI